MLARGSVARAGAWLLAVSVTVVTPSGVEFNRVREAIRAVAIAAGCTEPVVMARWTGKAKPMTWYVECDTGTKHEPRTDGGH